jgi:hypothetical protein
MTFVSHLFSLFNRRVFLVEHNTLVPSNNLKLLLFKLISKNCYHIALEAYISKYITEVLHRKSLFVKHPIESDNSFLVKDTGTSTVSFFMPSTTVDLRTADEILSCFKGSPSNRNILYLKGQSSLSSDAIVYELYYQDYQNKVLNSNYVIIPQDFEYRVSGVFYDALPGTAKILMSDCLFSRHMKLLYDDRVIIVNDWVKLNEAIKNG